MHEILILPKNCRGYLQFPLICIVYIIQHYNTIYLYSTFTQKSTFTFNYHSKPLSTVLYCAHLSWRSYAENKLGWSQHFLFVHQAEDERNCLPGLRPQRVLSFSSLLPGSSTGAGRRVLITISLGPTKWSFQLSLTWRPKYSHTPLRGQFWDALS